MKSSLLWFSLAASSVSSLEFNHREFAKARLSTRQSVDDYFTTHNISTTLDWYTCYSTLQCARLSVPVDYDNRHNMRTFSLALVKVPADPNVPRKGTLILVDGAASNIDILAQDIDPETAGSQPLAGLYRDVTLPDSGYDVVFWDMRGSGHTTPTLKCFASDAARDAYDAVERGVVLGDFSGTNPPTTANIKSSIQAVSAHQTGFTAGCLKYFGDYTLFMGTADNARDMNQIVTLLKAQSSGSIFMRFHDYSTALGVTYASLYPDGFDRMLLDGTVDVRKVLKSGDNGVSSIQDASKAEQVFFDSCAAAGAGGCGFWAATPALVKQRFLALRAKYYYAPFISNPPNPTCGECKASYHTIATSLQTIIELGPALADFAVGRLVEWESGSAPAGGAVEFFSNFQPDKAFYLQAAKALDQGSAITDLSKQVDYLKDLNTTDETEAGSVGTRELYAANWPGNSKLRHPFAGSLGGKTKGAMVFLGMTADPLTPLANAKAMSSLFPNSEVLTFNALGHTTFYYGTTQCLAGFLTPFWNAGTLPPRRAFCNDAFGLFGVQFVKDYR